MKNINVNQSIQNLSTVTRYGIVLATAILLGKICWWLANPLGYATIHEMVSNANVKATSSVAAGIVNRAPFGVVAAEKVAQPSIVDQVKVVGIYAAGPNNSIAFIQINNKNSIATVGDMILDAKLTSISAQGIILYSESQNVSINLSSAGTSSSVATPANPPNSYTNNNNNNNNNNSYIPNSAPTASNNPSPATDVQQNNDHDDDAIADKRRKMIEAFQKQNANNDNQSTH